MKKTLHFFLTSILIFSCLAPLPVRAEDRSNDSKISPTAKIVTFHHTKNNNLLAKSNASATIISKDGLILTNNHAVTDDEKKPLDIFKVCLTLEEEKKPVCEYSAFLVARNEHLDLALLKLFPEDIRGNDIPQLTYLPYDFGKTISVGDEIFIHGYPGIGGETITVTKGQVSGFEEINSVRYIKTDTDISSGNSGGSALDRNGNFVGVPTYIRSSLENLGYFLDISEARSWIKENKDNDPEINHDLQKILAQKTRIFNDAEKNQKYTHPFYPEFTVTLPDKWEFSLIDRYNVISVQETSTKTYNLSISLKDHPFTASEHYLYESIFKKYEQNKRLYENYKKEDIRLDNIPAYKISHNSYGQYSYVNYIIPFGYSVISITYAYEIKDRAEDEKRYEDIIQGIQFGEAPKSPPVTNQLIRENPSFSIKTFAPWHLQNNLDPNNEDLIAYFLREESPEGRIAVLHQDLPDGYKEKSLPKFLSDIIEDSEYLTGFRLVNRNDEVTVDGLNGFSYTFTYQGDEYQQTRKRSDLYLVDGDSYYQIIYDDLSADYDTYLPSFKKILLSFENSNPEGQENKSNYQLGSLNYIFFDITYHRYEQPIAKLKEKGIVGGYADNTFRPETPISRAETLKIIVASKIHADKEKNDMSVSGELDSFSGDEHDDLDFTDTKELQDFRQYLRYAKKHEIVQGYSGDRFGPQLDITLAETLKIIFKTFDIPVWESDTITYPWYKPFMDKGFELNIIPAGLYFHDHRITRGELCYIIEKLMSVLESRLYY